MHHWPLGPCSLSFTALCPSFCVWRGKGTEHVFEPHPTTTTTTTAVTTTTTTMTTTITITTTSTTTKKSMTKTTHLLPCKNDFGYFS